MFCLPGTVGLGCHPRYWGIPLPILFLPLVKFECIPRESCAGNLFPNVLKVVSAEKCVGYQCPKSLHEPIPWSHMWDYYPNSLRLSQECALALLQEGSVQSLSPAPGAMLSGFPASRIFFTKLLYKLPYLLLIDQCCSRPWSEKFLLAVGDSKHRD